MRKGLSCVGDDTDLVFIHDGVRPFPSFSVISKTVKTAAAFGSAVAATPTASTIKIVKKQKFVTFTPDRNNLWIIGTPQVFRRKLLLKAYKKAGRRPGRVFDDSSLVERLGAKVKVVLDSYENIKITTPLDLVIGEAILRNGGKK